MNEIRDLSWINYWGSIVKIRVKAISSINLIFEVKFLYSFTNKGFEV